MPREPGHRLAIVSRRSHQNNANSLTAYASCDFIAMYKLAGNTLVYN